MTLDFDPVRPIPCEGQEQLFTPPPPSTHPVPVPADATRRKLIEHAVTITPARNGWRAVIIGTSIADFATSPHAALARLLGQPDLDPALVGLGPGACHRCGTTNPPLAHSPKGSTHVAWYCENPCAPQGSRPTRRKTTTR